GAAGIAELGTLFGDNLVSLFLLWSLFLWLRAVDSGPHQLSPRWTLLGGTLGGIAVGLKLTFALYALAWCIAVLPLLMGRRPNWRPVVRFAGGGILGFLVAAGPWFLIL